MLNGQRLIPIALLCLSSSCGITEAYNPGDPTGKEFYMLRIVELALQPAPPAVVHLFGTAATFDGNLVLAGGGPTARAGADNLCSIRRANLTLAPRNRCTQVRALLSFAAGDQMTNMPANFSVPSGIAVVGPSGTEVAASFSDLLATAVNLKVTLQAAGVVTAATFWSHSQNDGTLSGTNCTNSTSNAASGSRGSSTTVASAWLNSGGPVGCGIFENILCVCFQ